MNRGKLDSASVEPGVKDLRRFEYPHEGDLGHKLRELSVTRSYRRTVNTRRYFKVYVSYVHEGESFTSALKRAMRKTAAEHAVSALEMDLNLDWLRETYEARIELLREAAEEEDLAINEGSVEEFWRFFDHFKPVGCASLVLTVEGDVRAVWRTGPDNHFAIHFRGAETVHYVVFKQMPGLSSIARSSGACLLSEVKALISMYKMERLVLG